MDYNYQKPIDLSPKVKQRRHLDTDFDLIQLDMELLSVNTIIHTYVRLILVSSHTETDRYYHVYGHSISWDRIY